MEIISTESNLKTISITNGQNESSRAIESNVQSISITNNRDESSRFKKGEIILAMFFLPLGGTIDNSNLSYKTLHQFSKIESAGRVSYNIAHSLTKGEVKKMGVNRQELQEQEKTLSSKIDRNYDKLENKITDLNYELTQMQKNMQKIQDDLEALPNKLKASKWDKLLQSILMPVVVAVVSGIVISVVTHFLIK